MWKSLLEHFVPFGPAAAADLAVLLAVLGVLGYGLYRVSRGTRAAPMLAGIGVLLAFYLLAAAAGLTATASLLGAALVYLPVALIVIFQTTLRRALSALGAFPWKGRPGLKSVLDDVALACMTLASKKTGALIVIEQKQGLRTYAETGIALDAHLSYDLLLNVFAPGTPLHDGAAIVQEDKVLAASCYLPLTLNPALSRKYGTRHRAAIGITEESDAVALVVSEERGEISLCVSGEIMENLDAGRLRHHLHRFAGS
jgi:diadenylate cyclase